ncbi:NYN domain-containing protein [Nocardioides sp.]|uniref:NYN domain-containing protein n=1 Tax=Nocardioides sp. TaxID=35761 RepID=UPI0027347C1C|nr:NYN domain-containing protein [Nocardioides sp.]MDP3894361.1 NYN domain-containing protein [Nocardioides sp.]
MPVPIESAKLAVLIDADNASPGVSDALLAEIAKYGVASVKRVYGDWTTPNLRGWKEAANVHAIQPIQQFAYTTGKNATDSALIIDAMDLLYTERLQGFCLVSSDSDFTRLASRLRESGVIVYGFGERKTPQAFVSACDKFVYMDVLRSQTSPDEPEQEKPAARSGAKELRGDARLMNLLRTGIEAASDDEGWANLGTVGSHIAKQSPDFDPRNWRYTKLVDLVGAIGLFEVERETGADGRTKSIRVREKRKRS